MSETTSRTESRQDSRIIGFALKCGAVVALVGGLPALAVACFVVALGVDWLSR